MTAVSLANRVKVSTATAGTGTITLGAAVSNAYCTFAEGGITDGQTVRYEIESGTDFEIGTGVYTAAGTTLTRASVTISKIGGTAGTSKINLSGSATVSIVAVKEDFYYAGGTDVAKADGGTGNSLGVTADVLYFGGAAWPSGFTSPINCGLAASAGSGALTIALKGADGNDPSASNPVRFVFRDATEATGTPAELDVTAATSLVISSGSTLGVTSSTAFRLWVVGFNDGGTFRLGVINCSTATRIYPLTDWAVASSTAEGGAGAADSAGVIYTGTGVVLKAYRIIGFLEWSSSGLTAGTWTTTNLSRIQLFGPGVPLPGMIVQVVTASGAQPESTSSTTFVAATVHRISVTPTSAANLVEVRWDSNGYTEAAGRQMITQLSRGATNNTNMIGSSSRALDGASAIAVGMNVVAFDKPNVTSSQTYALQFKSLAAATVTIDSGGMGWAMSVQELMG